MPALITSADGGRAPAPPPTGRAALMRCGRPTCARWRSCPMCTPSCRACRRRMAKRAGPPLISSLTSARRSRPLA
eukprot:7099892-Prymnesium_polylepis.1